MILTTTSNLLRGHDPTCVAIIDAFTSTMHMRQNDWSEWNRHLDLWPCFSRLPNHMPPMPVSKVPCVVKQYTWYQREHGEWSRTMILLSVSLHLQHDGRNEVGTSSPVPLSLDLPDSRLPPQYLHQTKEEDLFALCQQCMMLAHPTLLMVILSVRHPCSIERFTSPHGLLLSLIGSSTGPSWYYTWWLCIWSIAPLHDAAALWFQQENGHCRSWHLICFPRLSCSSCGVAPDFLLTLLRPFAALGLYFWAKRKKWVMSPNIAQKLSKIPLQPSGLFSKWAISK
jgi:hypothetical protein